MALADAAGPRRGASREPEHLADLVPVAAERWPDAPAVVGDEQCLSWIDVERRTRRLAEVLVAAGVTRGDRVAVARLKSNESFEAVHAILRAGAAVVPVDPMAPPEPVREILADAGVVAVVGDAATIGPVEPWSAVGDLRCVVATGGSGDARVVDWARAVEGELGADGTTLPAVDPDDIAYLIYTSGSTGRPKGIVHTHRSGLAYARTAADDHGLRRDDRVAGMSPLHFDMSTLELYAAPYVGACVVTMSELLARFPASFTDRCERERVTVWYGVTSLIQQVVERGGVDRRDLGALRWVGYGGEPYPIGALRALMDACPDAEIVNVYGPAEVNACTTHVVDRSSLDVGEVPIGRPWPAAEVRVVDEHGDDVPAHVPGELLVSATTAMREYWRRPELTRERLRPRPDGPPWYATGDIVEADADGLLWFRGRRDHQVKVRGVRLELESIEAVLAAAPGVSQSVAGVVGGPGDGARIGAVVVADGGQPVDVNELRAWCAARLPPVAIPADIVISDGLPTTQSGKIDRRRVRAELMDRPHAADEEGHGVA